MLRRHQLRVLGADDEAEVLALCDRDPVSNVFVTSRVEQVGSDPAGLGGQLWGWYERGVLVSACWNGANMIPVQPVPEAVRAFADRAVSSGRRCSSIVGPSEAVTTLWSLLEPYWGQARDVRAQQPLMLIDRDSPIAPDPRVRVGRREDFDLLMPACVAMFTEEVGYSPVDADGGGAYRHRVAQLVDAGRSFVRIEQPEGDQTRLVFKAELGAVSRRVAQVQGVYVDPRHRGQGICAPGMAAVVNATRAQGTPAVSLYVNSFNARALSAYRHAGFRRVGTFATVLF